MVCIEVPSSKSEVHRLLIAAALCDGDVEVRYKGESEDIRATKRCIEALRNGDRNLYVGESGSTLRFMLAVAGALGARITFHMEGRLPERPLEPYDEELMAHGLDIHKEGSLLYVRGKLKAGEYRLPGNVSSQYVTGLLLALPILEGESCLIVTEPIESAPYIDITTDVLDMSGIIYSKTETAEGICYEIPGGQTYRLPQVVKAEGDYSAAAFWMCLGAITEDGIRVSGLNVSSSQGDRNVVGILRDFGASVTELEDGYVVKGGMLKGTVVDASQVPDLVPALAVVAACSAGRTDFVSAARLRLKESDRIRSTAAMARAFGADAAELPDGIVITGRGAQATAPGAPADAFASEADVDHDDATLGASIAGAPDSASGARQPLAPRLKGGCVVDSYGDHRIAMAAGIASVVADGEVTITDKGCVAKSYPGFWEDLDEYLSRKNH